MSKPPKKYALIGTSCVEKTTLLSQIKAFLNANDPQLTVAYVKAVGNQEYKKLFNRIREWIFTYHFRNAR